jgi:NADP-dependent 3-hydroxy acid dehydrogenase YdfG
MKASIPGSVYRKPKRRGTRGRTVAGRVVVITGASSGIGAALARSLGSRGDSLVLAARREGLLRAVAKESGRDTLVAPTDVTKRKEVERLRDSALEEFGHIDVWVNNAGRGTNKRVADLTDEDVRGALDTVLMSVLYGMQAVLPHFRERKRGHIINVSSVLGRVPVTTYRSIYSASKGAMNILSANLRMDLRKDYPAIRVSVVLPGIVDTPFHEIAGPGLAVRAGGLLGQTRVESAEEVASSIVGLMDNPAAELYTNPSSHQFVQAYYRDVGAFEEEMASRVRGESPGSGTG